MPYTASATDDLSDLDVEPTLSQTKLTVEKGDFVGNVKKLSYDQGFFYEIESPVGTASIRGTTWTLTIVADVQSGIDGVFGISEGSAIFVDLNNAQNAAGPKTVVKVAGTVDPQEHVSIRAVAARLMTEAETDSVDVQPTELVALVEATNAQSISGAGEPNTDAAQPPPPPLRKPQVWIFATSGEGSTTDSPPPR